MLKRIKGKCAKPLLLQTPYYNLWSRGRNNWDLSNVFLFVRSETAHAYLVQIQYRQFIVLLPLNF